jgi:hypothetical protein
MPVKREIVYPVFLECLEYTDDIFWKSIFEDLAYGKAPHGTYISKGFLCCSYKGKEFSYKLERKDPEILWKEIYTILTDKIGIFSQKERNKQKTAFSEMQKLARNDTAHSRKKNTKDMLYEKYVLRMKKEHNLTIKQAKYLLAVISICMLFKTISSKDIIMKDDKIDSINGIQIENGEIILKKPLCSIGENNHKEQGEKCFNFMSDNWTPYLEGIKSKYKL